MSLASHIAASSRHPTATVRVNGARWDGWLTLSRDQSYGGNISGGTVAGRALPVGVAIGTPISWSWGYDREETAGFSGVVAEIDTSSYPNRVSLRVADPLWKAGRRQKDIATTPINSIAASTAITQILSGAGIARIAIPPIAASGSAWAGDEWIMGTLTPVAFANSTALAAAQRIAETLGYWLYADASGVVRAVLLERRPSDSPFRTLKWGEDFLIAGPPSRRQPDTRKNRIVIKGGNTGVQGAQIRDAWQDDPGDRSDERTFELIEYVNESEAGAASITGVARRVLRLLNRDPNVIEIPRLRADPRLSVGMTLAVACAPLGYTTPKAFFLYSLSTKLDRLKGDFSSSLTLDGGTGGGGYTLMPPPEASFSWRLVKETLNGAGVVEVFLDGSGSVALGGGEIVSYAWSTATTVASGYASTASGPKAMLVFPAATVSAEITLTVMDTSSKTGSITQTVPLAGDATMSVTTRTISVALGSAWAVTPDGGATWHVETVGDSTLVPEVAGLDGLASTAGSGSPGIRGSIDALATASAALVADLGGQITAMWDTQTLGRRWAAAGLDLYLTIDNWATHTLWGTLPDTIVGILEDPAVFNSVFVLAGADMLHSTLDTPGTAWAVLYAGPAGATARQLVRGQSGATTWIAYAGTFIGSPLQRVEGPISVTFPIVTPDVTEIRAIALSPDELSLYAWDQEGRGWSIGGQDGLNVTAHATGLAAGETAQHALHDPDDSIVYLATFGAAEGTTYKYFPLADALMAFYVPAIGQQAHRVGLGAAPRLATELLVLTNGATPGGVWHLTAAGWVLKNSGLPSGWRWLQVAVSPFNPDDWLIIGYKVSAGFARGGGVVTSDGEAILWRTTTAGASWFAVPLADPAENSGSAFQAPTGGICPQIGYTSTGRLFFADMIYGSTDYGFLWSGTTSLEVQATEALPNITIYGVIAGVDGEVVIALGSSATQQVIRYVPAGGSSFLAGSATPLGLTSALGAALALGRVNLTRRVVVGRVGYKVANDYRADLVSGELLTFDYTLAIGYGDAFVAGSPSKGMRRISDLAGAPAAADILAMAGIDVTVLANDHAQQIVAGLSGDDTTLTAYWTEDGIIWQSIAGPSGGGLSPGALGVITRAP